MFLSITSERATLYSETTRPGKIPFSAFCHALRQVLALAPTWRAIVRQLHPRARKLAILESDRTLRGRPSRFPFARALRSPAFTRSTMSDRSSSATEPKIVKTMRPTGVEVSIPSVSEMNSIQSDWKSSSARSKWLTLLAKRSNFQTTTTSQYRRFASAMSLSSCGRFSEHSRCR